MALVFCLSLVYNMNAQTPKKYFLLSEFELDSAAYSLSYSAEPVKDYIKQEYLTKTETLDSFKTKIIVDLKLNDTSVANLVNGMTTLLGQRQQADKTCQFQLAENETNGEYVLDFMFKDLNEKGTEMLEWNVFRYLKFTAKNGKQGIMIIGITKRAYGSDIPEFLKNINATKKKYVSLITKIVLPEIQFTK